MLHMPFVCTRSITAINAQMKRDSDATSFKNYLHESANPLQLSENANKTDTEIFLILLEKKSKGGRKGINIGYLFRKEVKPLIGKKHHLHR